MSDDSDDYPWVTTDRGTVERLAEGTGATPVAHGGGDGESTLGVRPEPPEEGSTAAELDWGAFFDRLADEDLAVAVTYDGEDWSFDVVADVETSPGESVPDAVEREASTSVADDPAESHHERATDEVNADNHRDGEPFRS